MSVEQAIGFVVALLIMFLGILGSVLPGIPSTPLVLVAAVGHRLYFGQDSASDLVLGLIIGLTLFSLLLDYIASVVGAKKLGATWRGVLGAVLGVIVGMFFNLPGLILGPFIGAALFEMFGGRDWRDATRAGFGAVIGLLAGALGKMACCVAMTTLFALNVLLRAWKPEAQETVWRWLGFWTS